MDASRVSSELSYALRARVDPLHAELDRLALEYIRAAGDRAVGLELMCERFFEGPAQELYPGGWAGMLAHAMRKAG
jgi:hypothetical protein